ncbi:quinoprotein dehydrogenase-associated SoxYZ-like carrier [Denitrobaculum tricleocarpae]|uniref:Quinoprotein dehydrogenase-associated SoxYZ-like carrier n=1 Tax=Denitrobaculum tricleocarpae TaxID=2591009 RepID=A0A545U0W1_9PROT|nr:quinoprotein dehydrogenase-associated SoxYZ-like carrier [Denitrobaculum tricleocarpae]TQV83098.1 quinoprotein dehydrogenase-associated SoxYZ-like carrier [Denitrobaculum tricleocarpae]
MSGFNPLNAKITRRRVASLALGAGALLAARPVFAAEDTWPDLKEEVFGDQPILDGTDWVQLEAPYRAHDAAVVPIDISALRPQEKDRFIKTITLVIDENPAPVAAVFHLGKSIGLASLSTRVRVNAYSHVRAIAEANDGQLYMVSRFVKASGGCSAPATKDPDEALASMGKMKLRQFSAPASATAAKPAISELREAQIMIRHPNHSGLQMDQLTRYFVPAHYVSDIEVRQGDEVILAVEGAISLSEDPSIRFHYLPNGSSQINVVIEDTEDQIFTKSWDIESAQSES